MSKSIWRDRGLIHLPFYYALCTTDARFQKELIKMNVPANKRPSFTINEWSHAATHFFERDGKTLIIVCVNVDGRSGIEVAGLLVHEAVHIWQEYRRNVGETSPSSEFEAYSIQTISQQLMWGYCEQAAP